MSRLYEVQRAKGQALAKKRRPKSSAEVAKETSGPQVPRLYAVVAAPAVGSAEALPGAAPGWRGRALTAVQGAALAVALVVALAALLWPGRARELLISLGVPLPGETIALEIYAGGPGDYGPANAPPMVGPFYATSSDVAVHLEARLRKTGQAAGLEGPRPPVIPPAEKVELAFRLTDPSTGRPLAGLTPRVELEAEGPPPAPNPMAPLNNPVPNPDDPFESRETLVLMGATGDLGVLEGGGHASHAPGAQLARAFGANLADLVKLPGPSAEAAVDGTHRYLFISMPNNDEAALVDTLGRELLGSIPVGKHPFHIAAEPPGRRVWVANDGDGTVTSIDTETHETRTVPVGAGHHDLSFTDDGRLAFVSNSRDGTVSVIDTARARNLADVPVGTSPHGVEYSALSGSLYVANEGSGNVAILAVEGDRLTLATTLETGAGATQVKIDRDWKVGVVTNQRANTATLFSVPAHQVLRTVKTGKGPDGIVFLEDIALIRNSLSPDVTFVHVTNPDMADEIPIGSEPLLLTPVPGFHARLFLDATGAQALIPIPGTDQAAVVHIMDGMPMAMGQIKLRPGADFLVSLVNKVQEVAPGSYQRVVRFDKEGSYTLTLYADGNRQPVRFTLRVAQTEAQKPGLVLAEPVLPAQPYTAKRESIIGYRLTNTWTGLPEESARDGTITAYRFTPGRGTWQQVLQAEHAGNGVYQARVQFPEGGTFSMTFSSHSLGLSPKDSPIASIEVQDRP